ncbi:MAG: phytoene desaturase [Myxococcota bacterium]|nr:phytoene desaturase [Myxococcota bacterium]MDW8362098.1 phytoene desaturase [Myxococcales bacterium]
MDRNARIVVIGAGLGGLATAIRLRAAGFGVTVFDRLDQPGGRARVFREGGFTFDAGPTVITAPFLIEELFALAGERLADHVRLVPVDPFYRIRFDDGMTFDYVGDEARMVAQIATLFPGDEDGYRRLLRQSERIYRVGFERLAHRPFGHWTDMARIVPDMVRLGSFRTVWDLVASHVRHARLRQILSFHPLLVGGNPFSTTSIYALIAYLERAHGVWYAMGGTGALVDALVGLFRRLGGRLELGVEVRAIDVDGSRRVRGVELPGGRQLPADLVVCNTDPIWTYRWLVPRRARRTWTDARLARVRPSMGLFVWYFGTRRRYPDVAHHTILLGPRYRGLLADIFERRVLADDFSLYLHRPTATDPAMAPPGHDAFYVLSPVPHLGSGTDWDDFAETYRARIAAYLERALLPGLGEAVVTSRLLTPRDFERDYLSHAGAAFGPEPRLSQSAYFRFHNASEDVRGLYFVGAGTHPGAGIPGVLSSAKVVESLLTRGRSRVAAA